MTEIGEGSSVSKKVALTDKKGDLKVIVLDICNDEKVKDAEVLVEGKSKKTDKNGEAVFSDMPIGLKSVAVKLHDSALDYSTFIVHYPKVLRSHEAKSSARDSIEVKESTEVEITIRLEIFKLVGDIVFHRRHIDLSGSDKYGHWWTKVDASISFGWWPKYMMGSDENMSSQPPQPIPDLPNDAGKLEQVQHLFNSAVYEAKLKAHNMRESSLAQTLVGVEGELNGQTTFGGTATRDPHHLDSGDEQYHPVRNDCFDLTTITSCIYAFASSYQGGWSWRFEGGNHCHTFQKKLMSHCDLTKVKVLK